MGQKEKQSRSFTFSIFGTLAGIILHAALDNTSYILLGLAVGLVIDLIVNISKRKL